MNDVFQEGEQTGFKANPDTVANTTRRAINEQNERQFQVSEFLTSQQVPSYFSTKKPPQTAKVTINITPLVPSTSFISKQRDTFVRITIKDLREIS